MRPLSFLVLFATLLFAFGAEAQGMAPANPHGQGAATGHGQATPDVSEDDPGLPPGTLDIAIVDPEERPIGGADVRLGILSQKISEGESRTQKNAKTDAEGRTRFSGLAFTNDKSYRVSVQSGTAEYASPPFNLRDNAGHRVLLHVYPATSDLNQTMIVMGGYLSVEARDDIIQLDVMFRIFNVSKVSWLPNGLVIDLPDGFKAFATEESTFDARVEAVEGEGIALRGTFPPGERQVTFRYQLPKATERSLTFEMGLPPRVVQMQVVAAASPEMNMEVRDGFTPPEVGKSRNGERILRAVRMIKKGEKPIPRIDVTLTGLHVPGPGRWVAVFIALGFAGFGGLAARGDLRIASTERVQGDRARARDLILSELVAVERAKTSGDLGPNAYERAHRALLDALARIGVPDEKKPLKKRKAARA